jgi:hypothetical protein
MSCKESFSAYELSDSSLSVEQFITTECIDNRVKFACFVINIIIYSDILIYSLYLFFRSRQLALTPLFSRKISVKDYTCLSITVSCLFNVIVNITYLVGVTHYARYLLYPVALTILLFSVTILLRTWFRVISATKGPQYARLIKLLDILLFSINICMFVSNLICVIIGPIVYRNDHTMVNWFYVMSTTTIMIVLVVFSVLLIVICYKFLETMNAEFSGKQSKLSRLSNKIQVLIKIVKLNLPSMCIMVFEPLWMLADLKGIFYFHFSIIQMFYIVGYICQFMFVINGKTNTSSTSSSYTNKESKGSKNSKDSKAAKNGSKLFSFTVEQMIQDTKVDDSHDII